MRSVALDYGSKIAFCEVADGKVLQRLSVETFWDLKPVLGPGTAQARVAVEACREAWFLHDQLVEWGHEPVVVDTTRCRQLGIGHHKRKNDRIDAEVLARAVERDQIPAAHVLSPHRRQLRQQLSVRHCLVESRAIAIVNVRGAIRAATLAKITDTTPETFPTEVRKHQLPPATRQLIDPLLESISFHSVQIAKVDLQLERLAAEEPATRQLMTVPGVAVVVAAAFVSVIDDPHRFGNAHQVEAYLGLVPSEHTSVYRKLGSITKQGNSNLRSLLVQAGWCILRTKGDDPLKIWGQSVAARRGKKCASVAVARRLAGVLWAMWRDETVYDPALLGKASATGVRAQAQRQEIVAAALERSAKKVKRVHRDSATVLAQPFAVELERRLGAAPVRPGAHLCGDPRFPGKAAGR